MEILSSIILRPIRIEDYNYVLNWSRDEAFCLANDWEINRNEKDVYAWWVHCVTTDFKNFNRIGIEYEGRLIGYVDVVLINDVTAEIGIAIGERNLWGRGIGTSSILKLMEYASKELGIKIFKAETHEANTRSRSMLEKIGFREIDRDGTDNYLGLDSCLIRYKLHI
ncbi:GNAT family N-acetyltransferase [Oceanobacillus luteolus]|uniref:GNAT family N-acetyltransferase n=1 Tax=Oceanobacillus luteolus TaxID=1274358 RepID=A0ABW4HTV6_9BACI|nr:GNAT family N-acetyltransferase [Oceanobacillus luteolus]MCM3741949.1 GNAT family N-acetyltransferase [Oceanobacillus luteolus]